jgi:hypothetical protein
MTHDRPDDEEPVTLDREDAAAPVIDAELQDQGLGNIRPNEAAPLGPDDEGIGNVRPAEIEPIEPGGRGLGSIRPEEAPGPDPDDEGIGSLGTNG